MAALIAAIGATSAASKSDVAVPPADANIVILREKAEPLFIKAEVEIDGMYRAKLGNRSYTALRVAPGMAFVRIHWPDEDRKGDLLVPVVLEDGKPLYFELTGTVEARGNSVANLKLSHSQDFVPLDPATAPERIAACCRYRAAEMIGGSRPSD